MTPGTRSRVVSGSVGLATLCSVLLLASSASSANAYVGYPNSIAVLGHSGATAESSDPRQPGVEVRANSWATGTNPAVNSLYLRILAKNPMIKGHNFNLAQGGATVRRLLSQATIAVPKLKPRPDLFLIQIMDNDIVCPGSARAYADFRSTFVSALKALARVAPTSSVFVVSQFGSPKHFGTALTPDQRKAIGGTGHVTSSIPPANWCLSSLRGSSRRSTVTRRSSQRAASESANAGTTRARSAASWIDPSTSPTTSPTSRSRVMPRRRLWPGRR